MLNLLSNAFKFTHQGSVTLVVGLADKTGFWGFSVIDTGIGIPPHAIEYIFEEFRQADAPRAGCMVESLHLIDKPHYSRYTIMWFGLTGLIVNANYYYWSTN